MDGRTSALAAASLCTLAIYEACAWLLDPLGVHADLNDGAAMSLGAKAAAATFNALPMLAIAAAVVTQTRWGIAAGFAFLSLFFSMQASGRSGGEAQILCKEGGYGQERQGKEETRGREKKREEVLQPLASAFVRTAPVDPSPALHPPFCVLEPQHLTGRPATAVQPLGSSRGPCLVFCLTPFLCCSSSALPPASGAPIR